MKALRWNGSYDVRVEDVPDPTLVEDTDILLRVTATAICGSDLHLYRGKVPGMKEGDILGHEFMGVVEDAGSAVTRVRRGDRVVVPFTISCGDCFFCSRALFAACENTNPDRGAILNKKDARSGAGMFGRLASRSFSLPPTRPSSSAAVVMTPFSASTSAIRRAASGYH